MDHQMVSHANMGAGPELGLLVAEELLSHRFECFRCLDLRLGLLARWILAGLYPAIQVAGGGTYLGDIAGGGSAQRHAPSLPATQLVLEYPNLAAARPQPHAEAGY